VIEARHSLAGPGAGGAPGCDWPTTVSWTFEPLDNAAFPSWRWPGKQPGLGGTAPVVYNGANEASVSDYRKGGISFTRIVDPVARVVSEHETSSTGGDHD
jgi:1-deoxy-D-xylulose-5-phosphate reductoisomerase